MYLHIWSYRHRQTSATTSNYQFNWINLYFIHSVYPPYATTVVICPFHIDGDCSVSVAGSVPYLSGYTRVLVT